MHARRRALGLQEGQQARLGPCLQATAAVPVMLGLGGCTAGSVDLTSASLGLTLLLIAPLAYGLGVLRERQRLENQLRESRAETRALLELRHDGWWQTDAQHQLTSWQAPGGAASGPSGGDCLLFAPGDPERDAVLQSQRAFNSLRVRTVHAALGAQTWTLAGAPRYDSRGAFAGYNGSAQLVSDRADQPAALPAVLAAYPGAAVLAGCTVDGQWHVQAGNAAARALWPQLTGSPPLDELLAKLPPQAATALQSAMQDRSASTPATTVSGWQIQSFGSAEASETEDVSGARVLVLAQQGIPGAATTSSTDESDNFSFTASHDLRAPIRVVEGFTRIVKEDYGHLLDRVGNDHLDRVLGAAARMNLMIDALLTLARLSAQPLARQPVNLSKLGSYIVDELRRTEPEREADIDIAPDLQATGDPTLLRLVLENLLSNAWKYTARAERAQISLCSVPHERGQAFAVRDNGAGFDMRAADRLFGLFQRLHSASEFPGHGVGLASVRRIVHRHGGEIWAEAEPGRGATFYFTLAA